MSKTDEEYYEILRHCPDFDKFPLPESWYKKFNLERPTAVDFKSFIKSGYTAKCHADPNVLREIRKDPAPGGVRPILDVKQPEVVVETKPVVVDDNNTTLR
jgi:hypothetical protein